MRLIYTCLTEVCGRCWEAERKKSAEGRSDEGDGGYYKKILLLYISYYLLLTITQFHTIVNCISIIYVNNTFTRSQP